MEDAMTVTIMETRLAMHVQILRYRRHRIHANAYGLMNFQAQIMNASNFKIHVMRPVKLNHAHHEMLKIVSIVPLIIIKCIMSKKINLNTTALNNAP